MSGKFFNKPASELRILVAPLDWGIGHATRCIPIIYALQSAGAHVILAADGNTEIILKKEFPSLPFLHLKGYGVRYSKHKQWFLLKLLTQFPRIKRTIAYEQRWVKKVVKDHKIDGIISDNRFGLCHDLIPAVYITHQLNIQTPMSWLSGLAQKVHYDYINQFTECWVPDAEGNINLGGSLSHPVKMPAVPVRYMGVLSRFAKSDHTPDNPLLVVVSGPEPQRTIFEKEIIQQLKIFPGAAILVRGLPAETAQLDVGPSVTVINYASGKELNQLIQLSEMVLCRAGYSTVMDLAVLQQKAILVPTPGQTEQEYLASSLHKKQIFYSCSQQKFNLEFALAGSKQFYTNAPATVVRFEHNFIREWLENVGRLPERQ